MLKANSQIQTAGVNLQKYTASANPGLSSISGGGAGSKTAGKESSTSSFDFPRFSLGLSKQPTNEKSNGAPAEEMKGGMSGRNNDSSDGSKGSKKDKKTGLKVSSGANLLPGLAHQDSSNKSGGGLTKTPSNSSIASMTLASTNGGESSQP